MMFFACNHKSSIAISSLFGANRLHVNVSPTKQLIRSFAVKELPWCSPSTSTSKRQYEHSTTKPIECKSCGSNDKHTDFKFGIIAAMDEARIIGINRDLPWKLPEDRKYFEDVTQGKTLIIGKNCFFERSDFSHISHLDKVIVVSTTLNEIECGAMGMTGKVVIAQSFEEAIDIASSVTRNHENKGDLSCWIGGGQKIYEKAIRHSCAHEIRLTTVHTQSYVDMCKMQVSFFPAKYRWDNRFKEVKAMRRVSRDDESKLSYTFTVHRKLEK